MVTRIAQVADLERLLQLHADNHKSIQFLFTYWLPWDINFPGDPSPRGKCINTTVYHQRYTVAISLILVERESKEFQNETFITTRYVRFLTLKRFIFKIYFFFIRSLLPTGAHPFRKFICGCGKSP